MIKFRLDIDPPTATAQEKQVRIVCGHPQFYEKKAAKEAKKVITDALLSHKPDKPLEGALMLVVKWLFPKRKADRFEGEQFKITKPDTDNLQKGLKDCMTKVGFWVDDAQVAWEECLKVWTSDKPGIEITVAELEEING